MLLRQHLNFAGQQAIAVLASYETLGNQALYWSSSWSLINGSVNSAALINSKIKAELCHKGKISKKDLFWVFFFVVVVCRFVFDWLWSDHNQISQKALGGFFLNIIGSRVQTRKVTQKRGRFVVIEMLEYFSGRDQVFWFMSLFCHKLSPQHVTVVGPRLARGKTCSLQG